MAKLIYSMLTSLDGYVADREGNFDWAAPNEEVHAYINNIERQTGTFLLGRRMYEVLAAWETVPENGPSEAVNDFGKIWRAAKKIVYSSSLANATTAKTEIERNFDAAVIGRLKLQFEKNISIGGPHLAAEAINAGLVDELHQYIAPIVVGAGNYWLPKDLRIKLNLVDIRKFRGGFVHLHYAVTNAH